MKKIYALAVVAWLGAYVMAAGCGGSSTASGTGGSGGGTAGSSGAGASGSGGAGGGIVGTGSFTTVSTLSDGLTSNRVVEYYVPTTVSSNPPLVLVFHGTGTNRANATQDGASNELRDFVTRDGDNINIDEVAISHGFIVAAPQALSRTGGSGDPDHRGDTSFLWNLDTSILSSNNDLTLVQNIITDAQTRYGINANRVYAMGFSNGGFFSYLVAMRLNTAIAAFAENSAGAINCANPDGSEPARTVCTFQASGFTGTTCTELSVQTGYASCVSACTQALRPTPLPTSGRVPPGYLAHDPADNSVSSYYTCTLFQALSSGRRSLAFHGSGHSVPDAFSQAAWTYLSGFTLSD